MRRLIVKDRIHTYHNLAGGGAAGVVFLLCMYDSMN
jgi:hypothetical protein